MLITTYVGTLYESFKTVTTFSFVKITYRLAQLIKQETYLEKLLTLIVCNAKKIMLSKLPVQIKFFHPWDACTPPEFFRGGGSSRTYWIDHLTTGLGARERKRVQGGKDE